MGKTLYLEGSAGISGDMTVGALLDLGGSERKVREALGSMPFGGYSLAVEKTVRGGLAGTSFSVRTGGGGHVHRHLDDILALLAAGKMSDRARELARRIFGIVAVAEGEAHGVSPREIHFHEVGAVDSICDVVAAAVLADDLGVTDCAVVSLAEGSGLIGCAHGRLPVPVPAVVNVARRFGIPLRLGTAATELVTPTGIAIASALMTRRTLPEPARIAGVGIGFGTREIGRPNVLRVMWLEEEDGVADGPVTVLEANVDDATGEELGVAMDRLFAAGALDCHFSPCFMKKNRPGWLIRVLGRADRVEALERTLFESTTTIGVRRHPVARTEMRREAVKVATGIGEVAAKACVWRDVVRCYPEADSVRRAAERAAVPFPEAMAIAREAARRYRTDGGNGR